MLFKDRSEAGHLLADKLQKFKDQKDILVLGLARGGMVVAYEVATALSLPLNVVVPRKIGAPGNPELALGSIMEDGKGVFNQSLIRYLEVPDSYIQNEIKKEQAKAKQRLSIYRAKTPMPEIRDQTIILVDDGIATGSTMRGAIEVIKNLGAKQVIVAVPVSSSDAYHLIEEKADEVICLSVPEDFLGVGMFYQNFNQTQDEEVVQLLEKANQNARI